MGSVSDMGVMGNAAIMAIASTVVAVTATAAATQIAFDQYSIGRRQLELAKSKWGRFQSTYVPIETAVSAILYAYPAYIAQYTTAAARYASYAHIAFGSTNVAYSRNSLCTPKDINRVVALRLGLVAVDVSNLAYRTEESRKDLMEDWVFNRRAQFLNLGRDLSALSAKFATVGVGMLDKVGAKAGDIAQGAAQLSGYLSEKGKYRAEDTTNRSSGSVYSMGTSGGLMPNTSNVADIGNIQSAGNLYVPPTPDNNAQIAQFRPAETSVVEGVAD